MIEVGSGGVGNLVSKECLRCKCPSSLAKKADPSVLTRHVRWVLQKRVAEAIPSNGSVDEAGRLVHVLTRHQ